MSTQASYRTEPYKAQSPEALKDHVAARCQSEGLLDRKKTPETRPSHPPKAITKLSVRIRIASTRKIIPSCVRQVQQNSWHDVMRARPARTPHSARGRARPPSGGQGSQGLFLGLARMLHVEVADGHQPVLGCLADQAREPAADSFRRRGWRRRARASHFSKSCCVCSTKNTVSKAEKSGQEHTSSRQNYLMQPGYKTAREAARSRKMKTLRRRAAVLRAAAAYFIGMESGGFRGGADNRCYITYIREAADFWRSRRILWPTRNSQSCR